MGRSLKTIAVDHAEYRLGSREGKHMDTGIGTFCCRFNGFGGLTVAFWSLSD
jgi:hypothetical protein